MKTFESNKILYLLATPIGNLEEISTRFINVINSVDLIACEDTRVAGSLLSKLGIKKPLIQYHEHNEKSQTKNLINLINSGKKIALISDAGYPLINDPGRTLINECVLNEIAICVVNGPSAFLHGLTVSGLDSSKFTYNGYVPSQTTKRQAFYSAISEEVITQICYESPHRILNSLQDALTILGNRKVCVARELTKIHETIYRGKISEVLKQVNPKGEFVLIFEGYVKKELSDQEILKIITTYKQDGLKDKEIAKKIANKYTISKNRIYNLIINN